MARVISKALSVPISAELEAKNKLLKSSPSLYQLYKDLVTTGLISAEEFWANHAQTRDNPHAQESGLPSAFLVRIHLLWTLYIMSTCGWGNCRQISRLNMMDAMLCGII